MTPALRRSSSLPALHRRGSLGGANHDFPPTSSTAPASPTASSSPPAASPSPTPASCRSNAISEDPDHRVPGLGHRFGKLSDHFFLHPDGILFELDWPDHPVALLPADAQHRRRSSSNDLPDSHIAHSLSITADSTSYFASDWWSEQSTSDAESATTPSSSMDSSQQPPRPQATKRASSSNAVQQLARSPSRRVVGGPRRNSGRLTTRVPSHSKNLAKLTKLTARPATKTALRKNQSETSLARRNKSSTQLKSLARAASFNKNRSESGSDLSRFDPPPLDAAGTVNSERSFSGRAKANGKGKGKPRRKVGSSDKGKPGDEINAAHFSFDAADGLDEDDWEEEETVVQQDDPELPPYAGLNETGAPASSLPERSDEDVSYFDRLPQKPAEERKVGFVENKPARTPPGDYRNDRSASVQISQQQAQTQRDQEDSDNSEKTSSEASSVPDSPLTLQGKAAASTDDASKPGTETATQDRSVDDLDPGVEELYLSTPVHPSAIRSPQPQIEQPTFPKHFAVQSNLDRDRAFVMQTRHELPPSAWKDRRLNLVTPHIVDLKDDYTQKFVRREDRVVEKKLRGLPDTQDPTHHALRRARDRGGLGHGATASTPAPPKPSALVRLFSAKKAWDDPKLEPDQELRRAVRERQLSYLAEFREAE